MYTLNSIGVCRPMSGSKRACQAVSRSPWMWCLSTQLGQEPQGLSVESSRFWHASDCKPKLMEDVLPLRDAPVSSRFHPAYWSRKRTPLIIWDKYDLRLS